MAHDMNLLVADPHEPSRKIIKKILKDNGYERVAFTASPQTITAILSNGMADMLLLDWTVAGANNLELLHLLDQKKRMGRVPKLLMGVNIPVLGLDEAFKYGIRDYVNKPFTPYMLMVKLERILYGGYDGKPKHDVRMTRTRAPRKPDEAPELTADPTTQADPNAAPELSSDPARASAEPQLQAPPDQHPEISDKPLPDDNADAGAATDETPAAPTDNQGPTPEQQAMAEHLARIEAEKTNNTKAQEARAQAFYEKGIELLTLRKYGPAVAELAKAVRTRMLYPEAYKAIAEAFRGQGDLERTSQFMNKAAETYAWLDSHEEAEAAYNYVKKVNPAAPNPYKVVGDHLRTQKNMDEVVEHYERAAKLSPKDENVAVALSKAYVETGEKEKAAVILRPLVEKDKASPELKGMYMQIAPEDLPELEGVQFLEDTNGSAGAERRRHKRIPLADFAARLPQAQEFFSVVDLTIAGIGFKPGSQKFEVGQKISFDLIAMGELKAKKLTCVVRRVALTVIGCEFLGITERQEMFLAKLTGYKRKK